MNKLFQIANTFFILLTCIFIFICFLGCSKNSSIQNNQNFHDIDGVSNTAENSNISCKNYDGNWQIRFYGDNESENKEFKNKSSENYWLYGGTLFLICEEKLSAKLTFETSFNPTNNNDAKIPVNISIKDDFLNISFKNPRECLYELKLSQKDKFLAGTYQKTKCRNKLKTETKKQFAEGIGGNVLLYNWKDLVEEQNHIH